MKENANKLIKYPSFMMYLDDIDKNNLDGQGMSQGLLVDGIEWH